MYGKMSADHQVLSGGFPMILSFRPPKSQYDFLPISLQILGINHRQEPINRPNGLSVFQWFYCVEGKGELIVNDRRSIINQGQGALIYPHVPHSYCGLSNDWTVHFFGFSGPNCAELLKTLRLLESGVYHFSNRDVFPDHIQKLYHVYERSIQNKQAEFAKECFSFLIDLSSCVHRINASVPAQENIAIQNIINYLEENYQSSVSLDDISHNVRLSKEYICTLFKQSMHQSIIRYLIKIRISRARIYLLQYPEKRVLEIARMCGFESPSYFGKVFKNEVGVTPDQYRSMRG